MQPKPKPEKCLICGSTEFWLREASRWGAGGVVMLPVSSEAWGEDKEGEHRQWHDILALSESN